MANFQPRRAPNVSQYIANLNTIPSATDLSQQQDFTNFDDDLALFTNTDFFDFDLNAPVSDIPNELGFNNAQPQQRSQQQHQASSPNQTDKMGFVNQTNFYHPMQQFPANPHIAGHNSLPPSPPNGVPFAGHVQQSRPTLPSANHFAAALSPTQHGPSQQTGQKRKAGSAGTTIPTPAELEEESRNAAEEDKRRRNTAASARFRVKKKQREQALEKTAKEMSERVQVLEARIGQLEMENQWLKGLITEKNVKLEGAPAGVKTDIDGSNDSTATTAQPDKSAAVEADKTDEDKEEDVERSLDEKKRGVGTVAEATKA